MLISKCPMIVKRSLFALAVAAALSAGQRTVSATPPTTEGTAAGSPPAKSSPSAHAPASSKTAGPPAKQAKVGDKEVNGIRLNAVEASVVSYTNQERARYGLPPLAVDKNLMASARGHAAWMTRYRAMVHTNQPVAENIAMGQPDSLNVVRTWMNSPGHRANILNFAHRRIGVGAFQTEGGTIFWCQQFQP